MATWKYARTFRLLVYVKRHAVMPARLFSITQDMMDLMFTDNQYLEGLVSKLKHVYKIAPHISESLQSSRITTKESMINNGVHLNQCNRGGTAASTHNRIYDKGARAEFIKTLQDNHQISVDVLADASRFDFAHRAPEVVTEPRVVNSSLCLHPCIE